MTEPQEIDELRATVRGGSFLRRGRREGLADRSALCEQTPNELRPEALEELIAALAERIQQREEK